MIPQVESIEMQDKVSLHHYRTEIPNIVFEKNIDPVRFSVLSDYFYLGKDISILDWQYFVKKGIAESFIDGHIKFRLKSEFMWKVVQL